MSGGEHDGQIAGLKGKSKMSVTHVATIRFSNLDYPTYAVSEAAISCVWFGVSLYTVPPLHGGTNPGEMVHLQSRISFPSTSYLAKCLPSTRGVSANPD
jgi:hypothetical protein